LERAVLVSDVVSMAGLPPGVYGRPHNPDKYRLHPSGLITVVGREALAGSTVPLYKGVANVARFCGVSWGAAVALATARPAAEIGRAGRGLGALRVGAPADVVVFRRDAKKFRLKVLRVFRAGAEEDLSRPAVTQAELAAAAREAGDL
jgi:N-acetylglucosamine-6-phosphate deacetylase